MTAAPDARAATGRRPRHLVDAVLNAVLNLAAVGGALCIVLVILALVFDISLILFRTGSMTPAIPQGSVAVVREIPAAAIKVGDIVTVDRDGELPITHRVTSHAPAGGQQWQITMQGDANSAPDPEPYTVSTVRKVIFSIPRLAQPIASLRSPVVLGGVTLFVTALVVWSLWPRAAEQPSDDGQAPTGAAAGDGPDPDGERTGEPTDDGHAWTGDVSGPEHGPNSGDGLDPADVTGGRVGSAAARSEEAQKA